MDFINAFIAPKLNSLITEYEQLELLRSRQDNMTTTTETTTPPTNSSASPRDDSSQPNQRLETLIQQQNQKVQALVFELNALVETASKKFPSQNAPSARFACVVTFELKGVLYHARKSTNSRTRSRELFRVLNDILQFRNQLWQLYMALGARRLRSLSMERASFSIHELYTAFASSPVGLFDKQTLVAARLESTALASLLRVVSHTARVQFQAALLALADARAALDEFDALPNSTTTLHYLWIFDWLKKFNDSCLSNVEMVFNRHINSLLGPNASKIIPQVSCVSMIENFVQKTDALNFSLILDSNRSARTMARGQQTGVSAPKPPPILFDLSGVDVFAAPPSVPSDAPTGINSFPCLFSRPSPTAPLEHMPNIISLIMNDSMALVATRGTEPLFHYDAAVGFAYAIVRAQEPHMFATVIWSTRQPQPKADVAARQLPALVNLVRHTSLLDALTNTPSPKNVPTTHRSSRY